MTWVLFCRTWVYFEILRGQACTDWLGGRGMVAGGIGVASDPYLASPCTGPRELSDSVVSGSDNKDQSLHPWRWWSRRKCLLGPRGWEHSYFLIMLVATLLPSKEPGPVSLEVHGHLSYVCVCEYFSLFHLAMPFLVSTLGAFPETPPFPSLFCYLTGKRNWDR